MFKPQSQDPTQQWTVHAQFTISHDGRNGDASGAAPPAQAHTEHDENGVRMVYTWTSNQGGEEPNKATHPGPAAAPNESAYAFQRGNLLFTSTPPNKSDASDTNGKHLNVDSSGYGSEMLSPNSYASAPLPRRPSQPYNRRCRSTCSIVLSTNINEVKDESSDCQSQCERTHSLRCQTPTLRCDRKDVYYGCGDPWCYHSNYGDDGRCSPVLEAEESHPSTKRPSRASTYSYERSRSSPPKLEKSRDASVQTYEMIDKCTSPFMKTGDFSFVKPTKQMFYKSNKDVKKRTAAYMARRRTEPIFQRNHSPTSSFTPDSLDSHQQNTKRSIRTTSATTKQRNLLQQQNDLQNSTSNNTNDTTKKPRTVHIDVYCTGTEMDSDDSSASESDGDKTASSPQTVFESEKVRITRKVIADDDLPYHIKKSLELKDKPIKNKVESEIEDELSTAYPSRSSFSGLRDLESSLSSVPPSWSTMSMSSYAIPDDDSIANTSWKDTVSDFGSLSRSSLAQTDSLDFVPRKLIQNTTRSSIDEIPELAEYNYLNSPQLSINPSDSFEYANSEDRRRIKKMENHWCGSERQWKSPQVERKHMLQQQKLKDYMDKRLSDLPTWESKDTESEESDASEKGWSFVKDDVKKLTRETTVRRASKDEPKKSSVPTTLNIETKRTLPCKSPSILIMKEKMTLNPSLRAPFTVLPGVVTEQRQIARKFGRIVDVFKKPGHHVGPAKNPDCKCDHCRSYHENRDFRGRTRSIDSQHNNYYNWKAESRGSEPPQSKDEKQKQIGDVGFTDF